MQNFESANQTLNKAEQFRSQQVGEPTAFDGETLQKVKNELDKNF